MLVHALVSYDQHAVAALHKPLAAWAGMHAVQATARSTYPCFSGNGSMGDCSGNSMDPMLLDIVAAHPGRSSEGGLQRER